MSRIPNASCSTKEFSKLFHIRLLRESCIENVNKLGRKPITLSALLTLSAIGVLFLLFLPAAGYSQCFPNVAYHFLKHYENLECTSQTASYASAIQSSTSGAAFANSTMSGRNNPPIISPAVVNLTTNSTKPLEIKLNASDPDKNDTLSFYIRQAPVHGNLNSTGNLVKGNSVTYRSNSTFEGLDKFVYRARDSDAGLFSNNGTVSINVTNRPPTVLNLMISVNGTNPVKVQLKGSDPDKNDTLTYSVVQRPLNGHLSNIINNSVAYTPDKGFKGLDNFMYKATDRGGLLSNNGTVTLTPANRPPTVLNLMISVNGTNPVKVQLKGSDPDKNDTLTYSVVQRPLNGHLSNIINNSVAYTPDKGFKGLDNFMYKATDRGGLLSNNGTVSINVNSTTQAPPLLLPIPSPFTTDLVYILIITVAMIVPVLYDMRNGYKHRDKDGKPTTTEGLGREIMAFAIIILLAILVFHVITTITSYIQNPNPAVVEINKTLVTMVTSIGTLLGGAVSSIIGFYFGSRAFGGGARPSVPPTAAKAAVSIPSAIHSTPPSVPP